MRLRTTAMCVFVALSFSARAVLAEQTPRAGGPDARVRSATYEDGEVYRLIGAVGFQIELEFEPGEIFEGHGGGDLGAVEIAAHAQHVILKPRAASVDTNLVIFTDRRVYRFHYSVDGDASPSEWMFAVRFSYAPPAVMPVLDLDAQLAEAQVTRSRNFNYWYRGKPVLKPLAVSDDGVHTRLTFSPRAELPAVFVMSDDGTESLLNFSMEGDDVLIHRTARHLVLRRGQLAGCVLNRSFTGAGDRLESGTISPNVRRDRR